MEPALPLSTPGCRAAAGACFLLGALLMVCAILVALTLDGQSGKGLLAEHQDANPVPRAWAAEDPWNEAEAQTGVLPGRGLCRRQFGFAVHVCSALCGSGQAAEDSSRLTGVLPGCGLCCRGRGTCRQWGLALHVQQ